MPNHTVVVTDHSFNDLSFEEEELGPNANLELLETDDEEDMVDQLARADAIINTNYEVDKWMIEKTTNCHVISRYGIGIDNIDIDAATDRGIYVTNAGEYCVDEVATHAVSLLLDLQRHVTQYDRAMESGDWRDADIPFIENALHAKTVGLLGFGTIARAVADRLAPFGADVVTSDPFLDSEEIGRDWVSLVDQDELLSEADIISIHAPLTSETHHLLSDAEFGQMSDDTYIVNVARGPILDEEALLRALNEESIGGAALDVFETEPLPTDNPLRTHDLVVSTPHIAYQSGQADRKRRQTVIDNVRCALEGDIPPNALNEVGSDT